MIKAVSTTSVVLLLLTVCSKASADYVAVDKIYGVEEGMFSRDTKYEIKWVQNSKGERWDIPTSYKDVSEYQYMPKLNKALCFIQVKSQLGGPIGWAVDKASLPTFYGVKSKTNDPPQKINPERLIFFCEKR